MTKWDRFWEVIQRAAESQGKSFFLDCGEGRDFETDTLQGEDVSGWLIPKERASDFEKEWMQRDKSEISDKWAEFITFAIWSIKNETVEIAFKTF